MPVITMTLGRTALETRKQLIGELSRRASELTNIPTDHFVVFIHELEDSSIGVGGQPLDEIKQQN